MAKTPPAEIWRVFNEALPILQRIHSTVELCGYFKPPLSFRSRIKSPLSIHEKISRKRRRDPTYNLERVKDVIGIRFVTLFREDISKVVRSLFWLQRGKVRKDGDQNSFFRTRITEFKQYITNPPPAINPITNEWIDPLSDDLRHVLEEEFPDGAPVTFEPIIQAQYSSVHIVLEIDVGEGDEALVVPVEVQVRTVFEDAWGEINHKLFYEADREDPDVGREQRNAVGQHLGLLKRLMDMAADYAALIDSEKSRVEDQPPRVKKSLDGVNYVDHIAQRAGLRDDLRKELLGLIQEKEEIDASPIEGIDTDQRYVIAAAKFQDFLLRLPPELPSEGIGREVVYVTRMEEAICRFLARGQQQLNRAVSVYRDLTDNFSDHPACWFRRGQACANLMELVLDPKERSSLADEASRSYAEAWDSLQQAMGLPDDQRWLLISDDQRDYIRSTTPRLRSYVRWRKSDMRRRSSGRVTNQDLTDVLTALQEGSEGLANPNAEELTRLRNACLYFALDAAQIAKALGKPLPWPPIDWQRELLREVRASCTPDGRGSYRIWHTIMMANRAFGEPREELEAANQVITIIGQIDRAKESPSDRELLQRALDDALETFSRLAAILARLADSGEPPAPD